jgi:hypothetical protein
MKINRTIIIKATKNHLDFNCNCTPPFKVACDSQLHIVANWLVIKNIMFCSDPNKVFFLGFV